MECGLLVALLKLPGRKFEGWFEYFTQVVLVGVAIAGQICLQNLSFLFVSVALYTMVGASIPIWQLCWGLSPCFRLETFSWQLSGAIVFVAVGLAVVSFGATSASPTGIALLLGSVCLSGFNGVVIQSQLQEQRGASVRKVRQAAERHRQLAAAGGPHACGSGGTLNAPAVTGSSVEVIKPLNPIVFTWSELVQRRQPQQFGMHDSSLSRARTLSLVLFVTYGSSPSMLCGCLASALCLSRIGYLV